MLRGDVPRMIRRFFVDREAPRDIYFKVTFKRNLGWKHAMAPAYEKLKGVDIRRTLFLTLTKNPYAWLLSLYRRPYHNRHIYDSFESFLRMTWVTVGREDHKQAFLNPIIMWNEKNRSYLKLQNYACTYNLRYEDLLENPESAIQAIAVDFSIPSKKAVFKNLSRSTKGDQEKQFINYQQYYLEEKWRENLTPDAIETINEHLDRELVAQFRYALL